MATNVQPDDRGMVNRRQTNATVHDVQATMAVITYIQVDGRGRQGGTIETILLPMSEESEGV